MKIGTPVRLDELANGISVSTIHIDRHGYETCVFDADYNSIGVAIRARDYDESMSNHQEMVNKYDR